MAKEVVNPGARRVALYARTSTASQDTENQLLELRAVAERSGWEVVKVYEDRGVSGSKGRDGRPRYKAMMEAAARREFETVMAWSVDRLGRSLQDLVGFLGEVHGLGLDLYLHRQGLDTKTPAGKALFQMCGVFAEFEREMIRERVRAGLARTKKRLGRPPKATPQVRKRIVAARERGESMRKIADRLGVSPALVHAVVHGDGG